jgi:hypothetical protein
MTPGTVAGFPLDTAFPAKEVIMTQSVCLSALLVAATLIQAPAPRTQPQTAVGKAPTCMTLLTDVEVNKVLGPIPATQKRLVTPGKPGHTGCMWARQSAVTGLTSLAADFMDLDAIKGLHKYAVESWGETWPMTLPRFYDYSVKSEAEFAKMPGVALPEIGERATLIQRGGTTQTTIIIQRADGLGTIRFINVSLKDALAAAQAFVAP